MFRQFPGAPSPSESAPASKRSAAPTEPDTLEFIFPERQSPALVLPDDPPAVEARVVAAAPPVEEEPHREEPVLDETVLPEPVAGEPTACHDASDGAVAAAEATAVVEAPLIVPRPDVPLAPPRARARTRDEDDDEPELDLGHELLAEPADEMVLGDVEQDEDMDDEDETDEDERPAGGTGRTFRVEDAMKAPAGFGTIMRAMGTAVSGFAVLALVMRVAPEHASHWLSYLPFAGKSFAQERNLSSKVELRNVQGRFERLRNDRRVFVISGDARNNSPMTIERIEVAGALYGLGGGELDQKVVTTGNRTPLTDLSEAEIVLLQRLDPAIALAPGETTPFLIVFLEPPRELREFSSRVLSVRPTRRASTPPSSSRPGSVG